MIANLKLDNEIRQVIIKEVGKWNSLFNLTIITPENNITLGTLTIADIRRVNDKTNKFLENLNNESTEKKKGADETK